MAEWVWYELGVGIGGLFTSIFFLIVLNQNDEWKWRKIAFLFTGALTFFSVGVLTQIFGNTWKPMTFKVTFPPLQAIFESIVIAFMVSGLWEIWTENLEE